MSLDWGRKPEYLEETPEARGEHANSTHTAETGIKPPTLECIVYSVQSVAYSTQCVVVQCVVYSVQCVVYRSVACIVYSVVYSEQCLVCSVQCTCEVYMYSAQCIVYSVSVVYSAQCLVCSVQCLVYIYSAHCIVHGVRCICVVYMYSAQCIVYSVRPGLTTTAIGAIDLQGAGGNWATVGGRSRGGRRVHRQREKRKGKSVGLRIGTLNVGTMTGKGRELADMMERRKVDILCVQETRWKGSKARSIGAGFKLFYYGVDSKRNGVGVVLKEEFVRNVLEVKRVSDRVMSLKLEIEGVMLNVVSGYAPQVGCELEEKERFWNELDEVMESIPTGERVVIGADFIGHVGEGNRGDEEVMELELRKGT
ncbi:hypothetical protein QTP86_009040 [Hemibagrus guttatus]|nr:hypothetical protein QTP86_009040 [Hemibagrus guttatus]